MKNSLILFSIVVILLLLIGCGKENIKINDAGDSIVDKKMFEKIGVKHNIAVQYILEKTDGTISRENILKHGYSQLKNVLPAEYQIFEQYGSPIDLEYTNMIIYDNEIDFDDYIRNLKISNDLKKLLIQMSELVLKELPINELEVGLEEIEIKGSHILNKSDLVILYTATSVAKYSANFWYPESIGGEGGMKYFSKTIKSDNTLYARGFSWGKLITVDAVGIVAGAAAALVSTGGAAAAPACGGIPCAGVVGLINGAFDSAGYAITSN